MDDNSSNFCKNQEQLEEIKQIKNKFEGSITGIEPVIIEEKQRDLWVLERNEYLEQYEKKGFSIIPIKEDKTPFIKWLEYQKRKPEIEEIYNWCFEYPDMNIGIITGTVSKIVVFDFDFKVNFAVLPSFFRNTTIIETRRGYHFYFKSSKDIQSRRLSDGTELKGNGSYILAPPSIVKVQGIFYKYSFLNGFDLIQNLPDDFIRRYLNAGIEPTVKEATVKASFNFKGEFKCIKQILKKELVEGEREQSFFILYNLLIKKNTPEYSEGIIKKKNSLLIHPLPDKEFKSIFSKCYNELGCTFIRANLPYIDCSGCKCLEKEATGMVDWRCYSQNKKLSADFRIFAALMRKGLAKDRNIINEVNRTKLAEELGLSRMTVVETLKEFKGYKSKKGLK